MDDIDTISLASVDTVASLAESWGNTNSQLSKGKKKTKSSSSRDFNKCFWCFTLNNYTEDDVAEMARIFEHNKGKYIMGRETAPTTGTHHIQGYVFFERSKRLIEMLGFLKGRVHIEFSKKQNKAHAIAYCCKEDKSPIVNFNYKAFIPRVIKDRMAGLEMKPWQKEILEILDKEPDPRKIYWYVDVTGGAGKTTFCHWLTMHRGAWCFSGKASDCKYAVVSQEEKGEYIDICLFDFARCTNAEYVSYLSIEEIKNGYFFTGKYESKMYHGNVMHVIVFSNQFPEESKMSKDRWVIKEIN